VSGQEHLERLTDEPPAQERLETTVSDELEHWLGGDQPKTLGNLIELFGPRSFALIFVLLMALPALPLPTGGATHVLEAVAMLVALQLVVGADASGCRRAGRGSSLAHPRGRSW
jgi:hypothetical protein